MKRAILTLGAGLALAGTLGGCTPKPGPASFSRGEANTVMTVQYGVLTAVRPVEIRPGQTRLGAITGAILGGTGGSQIGSSTAANIASAVGGAVAGGVVGSAIQGSGRNRGVELTLRLDAGDSVAVVQPGNASDYRVGDRVRLTGSAERARVTRLN